MASTNHTSNYQLSQFAQTDKPAWLGDYNQDMSKIDTAMKNNADAISTLGTTVSGHTTAIAGNTSDIATAQSDITALGTRVTAVETKNTEQDTAISNAQTTATTADGKADTNSNNIATQALEITSLQTDVATNTSNIATQGTAISNLQTALNGFETKFNLTNIVTKERDEIVTWSNVYGGGYKMTLAQNSDGSIFKLYGLFGGGNSSGASQTIAKTAVTGLSGYYGIKTPFQLTHHPEASYLVTTGGVSFKQAGTPTCGEVAFAVDTDGYIYLMVDSDNTYTFANGTSTKWFYPACVYFNDSFGDTPSPQSA